MQSTPIQRGGWQLVLAAVVALVVSTFAFAPAQAATKAPPKVVVKASGGLSKAYCRFKPKSVDVAKDTVSGTLKAYVKPKSSKPGAGKKFVHVYVSCGLFDSKGNTYYTEVRKDRAGGTVSVSKKLTVPRQKHYQLCLNAHVVYKDGRKDGVFGKCTK